MNNTQSTKNKRGNVSALKVIGNYTLTSHILGKGVFGEVVLAHTKEADNSKEDPEKNWVNQYMACKIIKKANLNHRLQVNLKSEIGILSKI